MQLVLATNNPHKIEELKTLLKGSPFEVVGYSEIFSDPIHPVEDGTTFQENALKKASAFPVHPRRVYLADDSGLEVAALHGQPGIFSARYGGENASGEERCRLLLAEMRHQPDRRARFVCVVAILFPDGQKETVEGIVNGTLTSTLSGTKGFGYDPIFIPEGYSQTFAQLGSEIKNKLSHRARALRLAKTIIENKKTSPIAQAYQNI